ncbi:CRAL/TRIO domain containing protein [Nitzschia inconspicua]|uniref:CRAL/TRIO domain containing protein n=1 Tax=Nitzschia inconspicua TaxID=303405 RepID=A0A9K3PHA3_9STRA|nr:CRAL/TRIO domain containing protein [Nitzschia inconspicua]
MGKKERKSEQAPVLASPSRLLTPKERGWTNELEAAIHNSQEDFGKLSDFELAAHAIVAKEDTELALKRIRRLQQFKKTCNISSDMTVFQAIQLLHRFVHAYPGFLQAFGTDTYERHVFTFRLQCLKSPPPFNHSEEDQFAALYYIFHALQPDLDAIRKGTIFVGDIEGITRQYFSLSLFNGGRSLTKDSYPIKVKDFPCVGSPPRFSAVYAMCWPFFSTKLRQKYVACTPAQLQQHFPRKLLPQRLGGVMSEKDLMEKLEESLKKRFENEECFRL